MAQIHFLYAHGPLVAGAALAFLPAVGALALRLRSARRLAREAAVARARMPAPAPLDGGGAAEAVGRAICVDGVLAGPARARLIGWSPAPAREAEGGLVVRVGADDLVLAGPVEVLAGTRESTRGRVAHIARRLGLAGGDGDARRVGQVRLLGPGDRVRVHGRVVRVPEASRYREARAGLAIEAPSGAAAVRVAALGRPRLVAWPRRLWAAGAVLGIVAWAVLFVAGGAIARACAHRVSPERDDGTHLSAAAWAAATPWREEAMGALAERLLFAGEVDRAEQIYTLLGSCEGSHAVALRRGLVETAIARAGACGVPAPADVLFAAGSMVGASLAYDAEARKEPDPRPRVLRRAVANLAAHRFSASADALADEAGRVHDEDEREVLECLAAGIRARGGDDEGQHARALVTRDNPVCGLLAADLAPASDRPRVLDRVSPRQLGLSGYTRERTAQALIEESGPGKGLDSGRFGDGIRAPGYRSLWARLPPEHHPLWGATFALDVTLELADPYLVAHASEYPWGIYAALVAADRTERPGLLVVRHFLVGHLGLFLAAAGDPAGARATLARLPHRMADGPAWSEAAVSAIARAIEAPEALRPFIANRVQGALDLAVRRAAGGGPDALLARESAARLRELALDRDLAVPLALLDALPFARW